MSKKHFFLFVFCFIALFSCKEEEPPSEPRPEHPTSNEAVNIVLDSLPYTYLSDYNFFVGESMADLVPNSELLLYEPITQLFTDYAKKSRYVWMPEGTSANYVSDFESLNFPNGSVLIKNFFYENVLPNYERKVMETRLLFKRNGVWEFADYIWNETQDSAQYSLDGLVQPIDVVLENGQTISIDYRIPAVAECNTCHKISEVSAPIGPKPQNLNADLEYQDGLMNQLMKWTEKGFLEPTYPSEIETVVDWENDTAPLRDRVRAYLDANCSHCHKASAHCSYRNIRYDFESTITDENMGICVPFDEPLPGQPPMEYIIAAGSPSKSMLIYRMLSEDENVQMPLIGKSVVHEEGIQLLANFINSLEETCN